MKTALWGHERLPRNEFLSDVESRQKIDRQRNVVVSSQNLPIERVVCAMSCQCKTAPHLGLGLGPDTFHWMRTDDSLCESECSRRQARGVFVLNPKARTPRSALSLLSCGIALFASS